MIRKEDLGNSIEIITNPEKYGYLECKSCDGFGGDNRREDGVPHELCEDCGGDGVLFVGKATCDILEDMGVTPILDESGFSSGIGIRKKDEK